MTEAKFPYLHRYTDNRGKARRYVRRRGRKIALRADPGTPEFVAEYAAALAALAERRPAEPAAALKPGTIGALAALYYSSAEWRRRRASTKATYRGVLDPWIAANAEKRVATLERRHLLAQRAAMAGTPGRANTWLKAVRQLLRLAVDLDIVDRNAALALPMLKLGTGATPWSDAMIDAFAARWPLGTAPRLALDLLLFTGQRRSDVVRMGPAHVEGNGVRVVQVKTGASLWIPLHPALKASIDAFAAARRRSPPARLKIAGATTFLANEYGRPFTAAGFGNWFRDKARAAGLDGLSPHGLRKAAGRRLAEAGASAHEIMAVLGHASLAEAARYTASADQKKNAAAALARLEDAAGRDEKGTKTG